MCIAPLSPIGIGDKKRLCRGALGSWGLRHRRHNLSLQGEMTFLLLFLPLVVIQGMMSFHVVNTTLENGQQFIIDHSMERRRKRRKWAGLMSINYWTQVVSGDKSVRVASKYALSDVLLNTASA